MTVPKKPAAPGPRPARPEAPDTRALVHLPPAWFITLLAVFLVPWAVIAWVFLAGPRAETPRPISNGASVNSGEGPWGALRESPIVISPPLEYVPSDGGRNGDPIWFFPSVSADLLDAFWVTMGMSQADIAHLRARTRAIAQINGQAVNPGREWIRGLSPGVRARLYPELAKSPMNEDQEQAFRFLGSSPGDWLDGSLISPATRAIVEPLIYRAGDFLYFADLEAVRPLIPDRAEMQRLLKTLLRHSTVMVRLSVPNARAVDALAEYWGRGGRRTDIRPLLESVAGADADRSIDIIHLLPAFARNHLYRYPRITTADLDRPIIANCLWSSLNFFKEVPDDRYLDPDVALKVLRTDYYIVEAGYQLGDIVAFLDDEGDLFHVAVYVAEDLAFTKNGTSSHAPWTLMSIDHIQDYYRAHADTMRLIYHRQKDF
jgi:hypothetical protein